ncbi:MAG: hypothetical protein JWQ27_2989 [Ferruginibacter sp.]|nr:hypothetical protein [Ferruginibacter sp.]
MPENWSPLEVDLIVADYFAMLSKELVGESYNKTYHRNILKTVLNNRSDGSIEFKHQNISAVLIGLGLPFIKGYKPKNNFQTILAEGVTTYIGERKPTIEPKFVQFADRTISSQNHSVFDKILDSAPAKENIISEPGVHLIRRPFKINYLEREQNNSSLGANGESLVIDYEKWRLKKLGKESLADTVEWVSKYNDGAGFDILSKNEDGSDRYLEVKTTKLTKETPIFFSKNEYAFSLEKRSQFYLYRLFNFNDSPKMFTLNGSFDDFCRKEAIQYKGQF